jgi:hypothetical protein
MGGVSGGKPQTGIRGRGGSFPQIKRHFLDGVGFLTPLPGVAAGLGGGLFYDHNLPRGRIPFCLHAYEVDSGRNLTVAIIHPIPDYRMATGTDMLVNERVNQPTCSTKDLQAYLATVSGHIELYDRSGRRRIR